jgi:ParB family chromosome partitioning protein
MKLEFHQLDRRWEHLRARQRRLQRRLLASLAESGQQTPIVVVVVPDHPERYLVIDGHKRIAALQQLGRDTVEANVWAMSEAEALLLERSLRFGRQESALEQGWLLAEMEQRFGYSLAELARRFDRSASWVSRRLTLVELLPEAIQQQVLEKAIAAQVAMRYLAPVRASTGTTASGWLPRWSSTIATRAKPGNSTPPGAPARAWPASASWPSRSCS